MHALGSSILHVPATHEASCWHEAPVVVHAAPSLSRAVHVPVPEGGVQLPPAHPFSAPPIKPQLSPIAPSADAVHVPPMHCNPLNTSQPPKNEAGEVVQEAPGPSASAQLPLMHCNVPAHTEPGPHGAPLATRATQVFVPPEETQINPSAQEPAVQSPLSATLGLHVPQLLPASSLQDPESHCRSAPHAEPTGFEPLGPQTAGRPPPKKASHVTPDNAEAHAAPSRPAPGAAIRFSQTSA